MYGAHPASAVGAGVYLRPVPKAAITIMPAMEWQQHQHGEPMLRVGAIYDLWQSGRMILVPAFYVDLFRDKTRTCSGCRSPGSFRMSGSLPTSGAPVERYGSRAGAVAYRRKHEESWVRRSPARERALLRRMLDRLPGIESVLDCPCGAGRFVPGVREVAGRVLAFDRSPEMVRAAREATGGRWFAAADAAAIPLADDAVDVVIIMRLLHHIQGSDDRARVLAEAARVARRAVIVSFADADTPKGKRTGSRRRPITREQLCDEAGRGGLAVEPPFRSVGGLFSTFSFALFRAL